MADEDKTAPPVGPQASAGASPPQRSVFSASEVLLLEFFTIARQRGWADFAAELLSTRAEVHLQLLQGYRTSKVVVPHPRSGFAGLRDSPDNPAGDRRPLADRLDDAISSAHTQLLAVQQQLSKAVAQAAGAAGERQPAAASVLLAAQRAVDSVVALAHTLLTAFAAHARTLPFKLRDAMDHHLALVHRRHVAGGQAQLARPPSGLLQPNKEVRAAQQKLGAHAIAGLALSGGGVRSASFAIGALQELNRVVSLRTFDVMSAVSGGSWAMGWLAAWAYRHADGLEGVERALRPAAHDDIAPLRWVRRHITYMVTRPGLTSGDTWALVAAYIANWLPIITLAALMLLSLLIFPHALSATAAALADAPDTVDNLLLGLVVAAILIFMSLLRRLTLYYREPGERERPAPGLRLLVPGLALLAAGGLAFTMPLFSAWAAEVGSTDQLVATAVYAESRPVGVVKVAAAWAAITALSLVGGWLLSLPVAQAFGDAVRRIAKQHVADSGQLKTHGQPWWQELFALLVMVAVATWLTVWLLPMALPWGDSASWRIAFGPLAVMVVVAIAELFGSMVTHRPDVHRAWAARLGGWMLGGVVAWTLLAAFSLGITKLFRDPALLPFALVVAGGFVLSAVGLVWLMAHGLRERRHALTLACVISVLALLLPVAAAWLTRDAQGRLLDASTQWARLAACVLILLGLARLANVNRHSLHTVYKQGLVRTFLGASRQSVHNPEIQQRVPRPDTGETSAEAAQFRPRRPQPSTNIDDDDNPALAWLGPQPDRPMPLLLINAAVNGVSLRDVEGRAPRQWPFTFSQQFTGSPADGIGYACTEQFYSDDKTQRLSLGGAMAVSSAAMSPISGGSTHPLRAFILGLLNARLGIWIGNPQEPKHVRRVKPDLSGLTVLQEMLGLRSTFGKDIHLSDGGHFENLGIYELVRRGCNRIVAIDASCDPRAEFSDLADAIRRARIDLHVDIHPRDGWCVPPQPGPTSPLAQALGEARCWMWFDIDYGPGLAPGQLLYVKPMVLPQQTLRAEVLNYAREVSDFPHESTLNQQYSEKQMEAYRLLGEACMRDALEAVMDETTASIQGSAYDSALKVLMLRRA